MAGALQERIHKQELAEQALLNHAMQQTVVAALGQFAITSRDFGALFDQAIMFVTQTLEVEYCQVLELSPDKQTLLLRAGLGWKPGCVGQATIKADPELHEGFALASGEPVVVRDFSKEVKFRPSPLLQEHGAVSGISVAIGARSQTFGVLGVYTTRPREFSGDDVHFLMAVATVLALAVERKNSEAESQKLAAFAQLNPNPAMETLTISHCGGRKKYGQLLPCHPSPFLKELPPELVEDADEKGKQPVTVESGKDMFAAMRAVLE
jgi:GAF domain-containing protein